MVIFFSFFGWYIYETNYKITFVGREESSDGRTAVIFQMRGKAVKLFLDMSDLPGMTKGRVIVERDGEKIKAEDFMIFNWGGPLLRDNWEVQFYPAGVEISLMGYKTGLRTARKPFRRKPIRHRRSNCLTEVCIIPLSCRIKSGRRTGNCI